MKCDISDIEFPKAVSNGWCEELNTNSNRSLIVTKRDHNQFHKML